MNAPDPTPTVREAGDEGIAAVLADHVRGDWSDRTFTCRGCADRYEEAANPRDDDERREFMREYHRLSKPNWTLAEYYTHVAAALAPLIAERERAAGERAWDEARPWWSLDDNPYRAALAPETPAVDQ